MTLPQQARHCLKDTTAHPSAVTHSVLQLLPLARIKKMMKEAQDVKIVSAEASWAVARATVSDCAGMHQPRALPAA